MQELCFFGQNNELQIIVSDILDQLISKLHADLNKYFYLLALFRGFQIYRLPAISGVDEQALELNRIFSQFQTNLVKSSH